MERIAVKIEGKIVAYIKGVIVGDKDYYFIKNDGRPVKKLYNNRIAKWVYEVK